MNRIQKAATVVALTTTGVILLTEPMWSNQHDSVPPTPSVESPTRTVEPSPDPVILPEPEIPVETITPTEEEIHPEEISEPEEEITPEEEIAPEEEISPDDEESGAVEGVTISTYTDCTGDPQPCIDAGSLTYYAGNWANGEWSQLLAGHDYMGYDFLHSVPTGTIVLVDGGAAAGTYEVYDHMYLNRQGGDMPAFGGASLVLQACKGEGTGFSMLREI